MISGRASDNGGVIPGAEPPAEGLKKGPWTAAEDAILIDYVKKHGEGHWNSVQKKSGLMRCGKSCRLRWANHLRPNLKKGSFTPEEERIIIELHAKLGNKWARMASQLPGRTDNEIKNYWNTRMKRRQRAGFPIHPKEFQKEAAAFHFRQQREQQKYSNASSPSFSPLLRSSQNPHWHCYQSISLYGPTHLSANLDNSQNHVISSLYSSPNHQFKNLGDGSTNNGSLVFPLSAHSSSSAPLFHQNVAAQAMLPTSPTLYYNSVDFGTNISLTSLILGAPVEPIGLVFGPESSEPPSNQTPSHASNPLSSSSVGSACVMEASSRKADDDKEITTSVTQGDMNSGLLDALLHESETLSCRRKSCSSVASNKGKHVVTEDSTEEEEEEEMYPAEAAKRVRLTLRDSSEASGENQCDDLSSFHSSNGLKSTDQEPTEEINSMDDYLSTLLNNFPSMMPPPEWYYQSREK